MFNKLGGSPPNPLFAELMATASALSTTSTPEEIDGILESASKATLTYTAREKLVAIVHNKTKTPKKVLYKSLAVLELNGEPVLQDPSYHLARIVLKKYFEGGKQLIFTPEGRFYVFQQSHWLPLPDSYLGNLLLREAMSGFPDARSLSSLISNAKSILVSMQPVDDSVWFKDDPLPIVNCANGEVWLDKAGSLSCARTVRRVTSLLACRSASIPPRLAPSTIRRSGRFSAGRMIPMIW